MAGQHAHLMVELQYHNVQLLWYDWNSQLPLMVKVCVLANKVVIDLNTNDTSTQPCQM